MGSCVLTVGLGGQVGAGCWVFLKIMQNLPNQNNYLEIY